MTAKAKTGGSTRAQKREQTRERLYQAALAEFDRVGTAKAQISDIARAAGVAYGSFYVHFEGKEDVLRECSQRLAERVREELEAIPPSTYGTARDFFERVAYTHLETDLEVPQLREEVWAATVRQPRPQVGHPHIMSLAQQVEALQERGLIRDDRPALQIAAAFLTALIGLLVRSAPEHANRMIADTLVDIFADAMGVTEPVAKM